MVDNLCHQTRHLIIKNRYPFIKPQALLALSTAICAWRLAKVKQFSRSEILEAYSAHWQQRRGGDKALEPNALAEEGAWS
jgi:hypothetical protein